MSDSRVRLNGMRPEHFGCEHNHAVLGTTIRVHVFGDGAVNLVCIRCRAQWHTEFTPESLYRPRTIVAYDIDIDYSQANNSTQQQQAESRQGSGGKEPHASEEQDIAPGRQNAGNAESVTVHREEAAPLVRVTSSRPRVDHPRNRNRNRNR